MSDATDGGTGLPDWPDPDPDHVLTWRQQRILRAIAAFAQRRGYAPSLREIGEAAELASTSSVSYQLAVLQRKGYLRRVPGRPRTIELRLPGQPAVRLEVEGLAGAADLPAPGADYVPVTEYGQIGAQARIEPVLSWAGSGAHGATASRGRICPHQSGETAQRNVRPAPPRSLRWTGSSWSPPRTRATGGSGAAGT